MLQNRLREILKDRGIKQKWLAEQIGVSQGSISKLIKYNAEPTLTHALMIAKVIGTPVETIWRLDTSDTSDTNCKRK